MSVYIIPVATGKENELKFMEAALNAMFMMEFRVDKKGNDGFELLARSYTEDEVSDVRKPKLIRAASEVKDRYGLSCGVNEYEGYNKPQNVEIERFASFDEAVNKCGLDAYFFDVVTSGKEAKPNFEMQYTFIYGAKPTEKQLKAYVEFMTGKISMNKFISENEAEQANKSAPIKA